jgi:predicted RNA-binding protein with PUA-like domain
VGLNERVQVRRSHPDVPADADHRQPCADQIKADKRLAGMALGRLPRLSVQPVSDAEWRQICQLAGLG